MVSDDCAGRDECRLVLATVVAAQCEVTTGLQIDVDVCLGTAPVAPVFDDASTESAGSRRRGNGRGS